MAFFATEEELPVAARVWKKRPVRPPKPPIVVPPKPRPRRRGRITVYWKCTEERWLGRNPVTGKLAYLCDQFFIDLKKSGYYERSATVNGKKISKVEPEVLMRDASKDGKGKKFKVALGKISVNENVEGN